MMLKQSSQAKYKLLAVKFLISIVLFINILELKKQELEEIYQTKIVKSVKRVTIGMTRIMPLTTNYINGVFISCFRFQME